MSKLNNLSFCRKRCTTTKKTYSLLMILQRLQFFFFASGRWSYIKLWSECQKDCFFRWRCAFHWRGEHRDLCWFWFWYHFLPRNTYRIIQTYRDRNYISTSCGKTQSIPSNDQHICFVGEQHSSNLFLNPYNLWDMSPAALMSLKHTNDRYSMSNQYP